MTRRYVTVSRHIAPLLRQEVVEAAERLLQAKRERYARWYVPEKEIEREEIRRAVTAYQQAGGTIKRTEFRLEHAIEAGTWDPISCYPTNRHRGARD